MSSVVVVVVLKYRCSKTLYFFDIHVFVVDSDMFVRLLVCLFSFDEVLAIMNDSFSLLSRATLFLRKGIASFL